jgi:hypothetical protein
MVAAVAALGCGGGGSQTGDGGNSSLGSGGASGAGGAMDAGGTPTGLTTLAGGQSYPLRLVVDDTSVFWTDSGDARVMKVDISGNHTTEIFGFDASWSSTASIAADGTNVYWTAWDVHHSVGTLMKKPKAGGAQTVLASAKTSLSGLAVDATTVYWLGAVGANSTIMTVPVGGGTPAPLVSAPGALGNVVVDDTSVYWSTGFSPANSTGDTIMKASKKDGATTMLYGSLDQSTPFDLAVDDTSVYWTSDDSSSLAGTVMKVSKNGGPPTMLASGQYTPAGIAVDDTSVYWTNYADETGGLARGTVMKMPKTGGTPTLLATGQRVPTAIVLDATSAYWTNQDRSGAVMRLTPK